MAKEKRPSSCLGLFLKWSILTAVVLSALSAAAIAASVQFFGFEAAPWLDFTAWNTRPLLLLYTVTFLSGGLGFAVALLGAAVKTLFGTKGGSKSRSSNRSRPQSSRRTTV